MEWNYSFSVLQPLHIHILHKALFEIAEMILLKQLQRLLLKQLKVELV